MTFLGKLVFQDSAAVESRQHEGVTFDDPPGYSPAQWIQPIFDRDLLLSDLTNSLRGRVRAVQVAGTSSGAQTGESFEILVIVLAGIGGGVLGAVGRAVWDAIKNAVMRTVKRGPRRALVEVAMQFEECDVILHVESRNPSEIPPMFDDADTMLEELKLRISPSAVLPQGAQTIEIRVSHNGDKVTNVLYSYPPCPLDDGKHRMRGNLRAHERAASAS
jgi:hypothetical protein